MVAHGERGLVTNRGSRRGGKKKIFEIALGIATSVGGFLDVGSIATSAQAGAEYRYQLLWAVAAGTVCLIFLTEMSGRLSAVSGHTLVDALRDRFGAKVYTWILVGIGGTSLLVLAAELGGTCLALQLATGVSFQWWAVPVAIITWVFLWRATFGLIDNGIALLSLVTLAFVVAMFTQHAPVAEIARGLVPRLPSPGRAHASFLAVSILGASVTPYLFYFYSSGAIEDQWDESFLTMNRVVSAVGMTFGGLIGAAVLVIAALVLSPRHIAVDSYDQAALMLTGAFGRWGFPLFVGSLAIACFGSALEVALTMAYLVAQGLGWTWGQNLRPRDAARFAASYTIFVIVGGLIVLTGVDPLKLTNISMALSAAALPLVVAPLLVLLNDSEYVGRHTNGLVSNGVVIAVTTLAVVLALVSLPLELIGR